MIIFLCIFIMSFLVLNSDAVLNGAAYGLMLWYNNVLPILLPFMLISGILVEQIKSTDIKPSARENISLVITFFLGVLCGYPLGAKTAADFVREGVYDRKTGNILLPLCNNSSPMFISGYVVHIILNNRISLAEAMLAIYVPYIIIFVVSFLINNSKKHSYPHTESKNKLPASGTASKTNSQYDYMTNSILQITYVGVYIMLCSIVIEFLGECSLLPQQYTEIISGYTEITRGLMLIKKSYLYSTKIKTALILSITSFGGVSAVLQTARVIKNSGLSIIYYITMKIICALGTLGMVLLLV